MSDKKYDQKFTFAWKDGSLDFSYEQSSGFNVNKAFSFPEKKEDIVVPNENKEILLLEKQEHQVINAMFSPVSSEIPVENYVGVLTEPEEKLNEIPLVSDDNVKIEEVKLEEPKQEKIDVILNSDNIDSPTVQIKLPEEFPQIISLEVKDVSQEISLVDPNPQISLEVKGASIKVPEDSELMVVKTPEGGSDIVLAVTSEVKEIAEKTGIDVVKTIEDALTITDIKPDLPDLTPTGTEQPSDVIPQVVQMVVEGNTVHLTDVSENIPENTKMIPIETPPEMPNIVAVLDDKTSNEFEKKGLDPAEELSKFLNESDTEISTVAKLPKKKVGEIFKVEDDDFNSSNEWQRRWARLTAHFN